MSQTHNSANSVIPQISDPTASRENCDAIDEQVRPHGYLYIIAWGKWLGFTPNAVQSVIDEAVRDNAPFDAIQKIKGRWHRLGDIENGENRKRIEEIASE